MTGGVRRTNMLKSRAIAQRLRLTSVGTYTTLAPTLYKEPYSNFKRHVLSATSFHSPDIRLSFVGVCENGIGQWPPMAGAGIAFASEADLLRVEIEADFNAKGSVPY